MGGGSPLSERHSDWSCCKIEEMLAEYIVEWYTLPSWINKDSFLNMTSFLIRTARELRTDDIIVD